MHACLQVGTDRQEDAVFRLCVRNLRVFGKVEVDLLQQGAPNALVLTSYLVNKIKARQAASAPATGGSNAGRRLSVNGSEVQPSPRGDRDAMMAAVQLN